MIEISYITLIIMFIVYFISLWFIFWKTDKFLEIKNKIKILEFENDIKEKIIDNFLKIWK